MANKQLAANRAMKHAEAAFLEPLRKKILGSVLEDLKVTDEQKHSQADADADALCAVDCCVGFCALECHDERMMGDSLFAMGSYLRLKFPHIPKCLEFAEQLCEIGSKVQDEYCATLKEDKQDE